MLKVLKLGVIGSLRSVESVKPNGNWKPKKFNLSHIWDRVLLNTNGLSLK